MKTPLPASLIAISVAAIALFATEFVGGGALAAEAGTACAVGPDKEFKTISSALAVMKDGDVCVISPGVYRERIDVRQNNVTLRGEGRVVITGCDEAGKGTPARVNGRDCLVFKVGRPVYDVFKGDQYLPLARHPDKTVAMTSNEDWEHSHIGPQGNVDLGENLHERFPDLADGCYLGLHGHFRSKKGKLTSWYSIRLPITGLTPAGHLRVDKDRASSGYMGDYGQGKGLGYIIGAKAVLDAPGEWYADEKELVVIPPSGVAGPYEIRTRLYGALITGDGVRLENIHFKAAAARIDGNHVRMQRCSFEFISPFQPNPNPEARYAKDQSGISCWGSPDNGTAGVFVQGDGFVAKDCRFAKSWWCGMMVRGNRARIENCLFEDMNWIASRAAGLFSWGDGNVVRHCTFRNLGGSGIEGGNSKWIGQYATNNVWEFNAIEDTCKLIVDQGFFYVNHQDGSKPAANSIWRYNVGTTVRGPKKGDWARRVAAYYIDNNSSGYRVHNNIAIDAVHPMKHNSINPVKHNDARASPQASRDIWFYNNTFYKCGNAAFGSFGDPKIRDAGLHVINNLAIASSEGALGNPTQVKTHLNNLDADAEAVKDAENWDFTPTDEKLKSGGVPVEGRPITYVGAVDPAKGMWRYGADESQLPGQ
jgi:hypothetical protein